MDREILKYLYDIQECINNIDSYIGAEKVFATYEGNSMLPHNLPVLKTEIESLLSVGQQWYINQP